MTTPQTFKSLGALALLKMKWVELRQTARRMGDTNAEARYTNWIEDCQARGQRINKLSALSYQLSANKEAA